MRSEAYFESLARKAGMSRVWAVLPGLRASVVIQGRARGCRIFREIVIDDESSMTDAEIINYIGVQLQLEASILPRREALIEKRADFLASLDNAEASLARGDGLIITQESMQALAEEVHRRGLTRLAKDESARR